MPGAPVRGDVGVGERALEGEIERGAIVGQRQRDSGGGAR
jgi:hypothetical protein